MAHSVLYGGHYPELQERFLTDVTAGRRADPLAPLDVVVSGQLLRLSLKRELARAGGHASVRFWTLAELAAESARPVMRARGLRKLRDVLSDPLMSRAVEALRPLRYFERLAPRDGFRMAIWRTLNELRDAGLTADELEAAVAQLKGTLYGTLRDKLGDLLAVWREIERLLAGQKLADEQIVLQLAAEAVTPSTAPLMFYGLDELSVLERRFVAALLEGRAQTTVYLPYRETPACAWVKPLYQWFQAQHIEAHFLPPRPPGQGAMLDNVRRGLFAEMKVATPPVADDDTSLLVVSAPSREREVEEITRELLFSPLAQTLPGREVAILVRERDPYVTLLRDGLERAGVLGYFHQCRTLAETPAGRAFCLLSVLLDERFRRVDVLEFLLSSPVRWPEALENGPATLPVAEWNYLACEAGIVAGKMNWADGLKRLAHQLEADRARRALDDDEGQLATAARIAAAEALVRYTGYLFARIAEVKQTLTWGERIAALWALFSELIVTDASADDLAEELEGMEEFDSLELPLATEHFRRLVQTVLTRPVKREARFQAHEPTVATLREVTGVLFDEVFLPGVVEKDLPRPTHQDPLFLDDERKLLNELALEKRGAPLPLRAREREREPFMFHAALQSARVRAVLSYPRREAATSRERLPSTYLLRTLEAATGRPLDYAALERFIAADAHGRRVSVSRMRGVPAETAATAFQYDEARLGEALRTKSCAPLGYLLHEQAFFARGVEAETRRFRGETFTAYDGVVEDPTLAARVGTWSMERAAVMSAAQLEQYTVCPFQYFVARVLDAEPAGEPPEIQRVAPRERGALVHRILERFYQSEHDAGRVPLQADALERLERVAYGCFRGFESENVPGAAFLWQLEQEAILRMVREVVRRDCEDTSGFIPRYFEQHFKLDLTDELGMIFHGMLDRIDLAPDGRARVVDYTTGKEKSGLKDGGLAQGNALTLPLHRLAAEAKLGLNIESAAFYYLNERAKRAKDEYTGAQWEQGRAEFRRVAKTLHDGMARGEFFPYPESGKCANCAARAACGPGKLTPKWAYDNEQTRAYRSVVEAE